MSSSFSSKQFILSIIVFERTFSRSIHFVSLPNCSTKWSICSNMLPNWVLFAFSPSLNSTRDVGDLRPDDIKRANEKAVNAKRWTYLTSYSDSFVVDTTETLHCTCILQIHRKDHTCCTPSFFSWLLAKKIWMCWKSKKKCWNFNTSCKSFNKKCKSFNTTLLKFQHEL